MAQETRRHVEKLREQDKCVCSHIRLKHPLITRRAALTPLQLRVAASRKMRPEVAETKCQECMCPEFIAAESPRGKQILLMKETPKCE